MSAIKHSNKQSGFVSIIVSITFVIIISLVATSFALLARREARQALDRQLSTQAFYAAESGVNDAVFKVNNNTLGDVDECSNVSSVGDPDLGNNLSYTCVLVDQEPTSLDYSSVGTEKSIIIRVQSANNVPIKTLQFSWQADDNNTTFTTFTNHELPDKNANQNGLDKTGIIRATIIPGNAPFSRNNLIENSQTYFLYPNAHSSAGQTGTRAYIAGRADQGGFINGRCNVGSTPRFCNSEVTGLDTVLGTSTVYVRVKSIYKASKLTIRALDSGGGQLAFTNAQAQIDATGKANDVLRRIQVRVPLNNSYYYPEFALETGDDICKRMNIVVGQPVNNACLPFN